MRDKTAKNIFNRTQLFTNADHTRGSQQTLEFFAAQNAAVTVDTFFTLTNVILSLSFFLQFSAKFLFFI